MGKHVYILNSDLGNSGVVKILSGEKNSTMQVKLNKNVPGRKKCFSVINGDTTEVGVITKNKATFTLDADFFPDQIFIAADVVSEPLMWSGEKPRKSVEPILNQPISPPDHFTFENFFGGGFKWQRIRGNFIIFDYSIIHHVLSAKKVYPAINRAGYYCAGIKKTDELTFIGVAIPIRNEKENLFDDIVADSYLIKSGKRNFEAICTGIDKTGEFFISI